MEQIEIIKRDGTTIQTFSQEPFCTPTSAVQEKELMSNDTVKITLRTTQPYKFTKGDKISINGEEYKIRTTPERQLQSEGDFTHTLTFYGVMYDLMKCQFRNCDANGNSSKSIFDLTYSIKDFVNVIIYNMNRDNPGKWAFDNANCPDTDPITISFSKNNCLQVLQDLCSEDKFNLEFRITQANNVSTIHIGTFGSVVNPPSGASYFEWGKGNGLFTLNEKKVDDKAIITRLWAEGGTQNIKSGYRDYSDRLQFPYPKRTNKKAHTLKDGTVIAAGSQTIGIADDAKRYMEDTALSQSLGVEEDTQTWDDIYPKRTGTVSALGSDVYEFVDSSMDFDLNEKDTSGNTKYLIDGTSAKITFITGKLAGQEFELSKYTHGTKTFRLIKYTSERGLTIPTESTDAFRFAVGDKYKLTDINMPDSYIEDAEEELWYKALDYFNEAKQARVEYELTFDRQYFLDNVASGSDTWLFKVGDYVPIKDTRFNVQKNIRIQKVSRNLLLEHDYTLTLSDTTAISVFSQAVIEVAEHEKIIQANDLRNLSKAKRGWRTTEELRNMVYDTDGYFDNENIRPNSIDTNMLTVGSKSQQFVLSGVILTANVGGQANQFTATAGTLAHFTILEDGIKTWTMSAADFTLSNSGGYYVFAKCSKTGTTGTWYVTQEQLKVENASDPNNYYFQVGIIGSLSEGGTFRDFTTTYGFTRINGNTITTGKIVTSDGNSYLDLDGNKFKIASSASSLDFNVTKANTITLKNVDIDSGAGDPVHLGVYRGTYEPDQYYYKNDEVSFTVDGETCTYRYNNDTATKGHAPTESNYWDVVAKGKQGSGGQTSYMHVKYSPVANPTDAQMTDTPDKYIGTCCDHNATAPTTASSYTWAQFKGDTGAKGDKGDQGDRGYPGEPGEDGRTTYLHIKYSNNGGLSFTENNGETPGAYMGQYTDFEEFDSSDSADYTWGLIEGAAGLGGVDADSPAYYEFRFAKNTSRTTAPTLDVTAENPTGWSTVQPTVAALEYLWQTVAQKCTLGQKALFHIPVQSGETTTLADTSGNGKNVTLSNGASVTTIDSKVAVNLSSNGLGTMTDLLPFGKAFTLAFWVRTDQSSITWLLNGKWGRNYVERELTVTANTWTHLGLRFTQKGLQVFVNGTLTDSAALTEEIVGFSMYDDNMFGSAIYLSDIWLFDGALSDADIVKAKNGTVSSLVSNWSTPVRVTPYDGVDGDSPVMVYRGVYDTTKEYYGNSSRVDAVKYNGTYYVAKKDAGTITGAWDSSKWNTFGAQFESIATNLLLVEGASIGSWWIEGGQIVSTLGNVSSSKLTKIEINATTPQIKLTKYYSSSSNNTITIDANTPKIEVDAAANGGEYSLLTGLGAKITINGSSGVVNVTAKNAPSYSTGTAYLSPTGIFANLAGTDGMPASTGFTHRGAIVGLGFANVAKSEWSLNADDTIVAGVYGRASNSGTAPAYGGYFINLKAAGLVMGQLYVGDSTTFSKRCLGQSTAVVIGLVNSGNTVSVYLPTDAQEGRIIFFKQMGAGTLRVDTLGSQKLYDDSSENDYYDIQNGETGVCIFSKYNINGVTLEIWTIGVYKF